MLSSYHYDLYSVLAVLVMFVCVYAAVLVWQRRAASGAKPLFLLNVAQLIWTGSSIFEVAAVRLADKVFWSQVGYLGVTSSPLLFLLFVLGYVERDRRIRKSLALILAVVPLATFLLAATNGSHHLIWADVTMAPGEYAATYHHGELFWPFVGFVYTLYAVGATFLVRSLFHVAAFHRRQIMALLLASMPPLAVNVLYVFRLAPWGSLDLTPLSFAITGIVLSLAVYRQGLLDLVPAARDMVIEGLSQGVIVLDAAGRIMDLNAEARRLLSNVHGKIVGADIDQAVPEWSSFGPLPDHGTVDVMIHHDGERHLELHTSVMNDGHQGRIVMLRDVTDRFVARRDRERLLAELRVQTDALQTLSGMLPICPSCKNIRDDGGFWHRVEDYVARHADVTFTHGICPDCMSRLYPEIAWEIQKDAERPEKEGAEAK